MHACKRKVELAWNGKTREVCIAVLPFQTLEHIDEPRVEAASPPPSGRPRGASKSLLDPARFAELVPPGLALNCCKFCNSCRAVQLALVEDILDVAGDD